MMVPLTVPGRAAGTAVVTVPGRADEVHGMEIMQVTTHRVTVTRFNLL
jgi:hypothetical protein